MRDPDERDASLALRAAHGNRLRKAVGWYRTHHRLHTGDQIAMAADALAAYLADRAAGKDALLVCDSWDMADALNRRLHDREHVHLGYAVTVHSAEGVTADTAHAVLAESASRAMAYVAMSRGRDTNHAYIYTHVSGEADHEHTASVASDSVHVLRRGTSYSASRYLRAILANDDRPRTMHAEAEHTDRALLPGIVTRLLDRHDARRAARRETWCEHSAAQRAFYERYQRLTADIGRAAERGMDHGYGLEL